GEWTLRIRNDASQSAILEGWSVRVSCASEGELQATTLQLPAVPGSVLDGTASVSGALPADACVGPVTDVNVVVQATTPRADLTAVEVTAPNGSTVLLKGGAMQSQGAGIWVVFDDEAASSIDQAA